MLAYRTDGVDVRMVLGTSHPMLPLYLLAPSYAHDTSTTASLEGPQAEGINIPQCHSRCEDGSELFPVGTVASAVGSTLLPNHMDPTLL